MSETNTYLSSRISPIQSTFFRFPRRWNKDKVSTYLLSFKICYILAAFCRRQVHHAAKCLLFFIVALVVRLRVPCVVLADCVNSIPNYYITWKLCFIDFFMNEVGIPKYICNQKQIYLGGFVVQEKKKKLDLMITRRDLHPGGSEGTRSSFKLVPHVVCWPWPARDPSRPDLLPRPRLP